MAQNFLGHLIDLWAYHHGTRIDLSSPGKPTANAFVETFNGSLSDECLNVYWFEPRAEARRIIEACRIEYNKNRPPQGSSQRSAERSRFAGN